jgi:predicted GIY-YIG superfamily endonuclease
MDAVPSFKDIINKRPYRTVFYVYILQSQVPSRYRKIYIGKTNDLRRRIKQHNESPTCGAFATRKYRPWEYLAVIEGFENDIKAQQFEYTLTKPYSCRHAKNFHEDNIDLKKGHRVRMAEYLCTMEEYSHLRVIRNWEAGAVVGKPPPSDKELEKTVAKERKYLKRKIEQLEVQIEKYKRLDEKLPEKYNSLVPHDTLFSDDTLDLPEWYFDDVVDLTSQ